MATFIAFLRGINVGGRNRLPMPQLSEILESTGLRDIRTYIQSGNVVFASRAKNSDRLGSKIRDAIAAECDFEPDVMVLPLEKVEEAMQSNPFPDAEDKPKSLHLFFLALIPDEPDLDGLEEKRSKNERFVLEDDVFYLHAPDGIGRSKLAASAERLLGVPATARNWRTVTKVVEMAHES